jgi:AbrB family looped-hinge helix DNA binding protein
MTVANRITTKGQVTIPVTVRRRLGLRPGDSVRFVERGGVTVLEKAEDTPEDFERWLRSVAGSVDFGGKTTDEWLDEIRPHRSDPI